MGYDYNKHVIAAVRQVRRDYFSDEGVIKAEVTDQIVFEYIDLSDDTWSGPLPLEQLQYLGLTEPFEGIDTDRLLSSSRDRKPVMKLGQCANPRPSIKFGSCAIES